MKCKNCGAVVNEYETVCPHCGELLKTANSQEAHNSFLAELRASQSEGNQKMPNDQKPRNQAALGGTKIPSEQQPRTGSGKSWLERVFNFDNIGGKIKTLAKFFCWIGIIVAWGVCAVMFVVCLLERELQNLWWIWPLAAVVAPFVIWVGSWATYSLGNFIENDQKRTDSQETIAQALSEKKNNNK